MKIVMLGVAELIENFDNREFEMKGEVWEDFVSSIKTHGVLQPLLVRPVDDKFEIVAGERRWAGAIAAGAQKVPCVVQKMSDAEALALMMVENLQRDDIDPMEEARGVRLLIEKAGLSEEEVSGRICKSVAWVALRQGLLGLSEDAVGYVKRREVSLGVVQMLLLLPVDRREEGFQMVLHPAFQDEPLNARQAEQLLEEEIIAPERARKEWEEREGELKTFWTVKLREIGMKSLDPFILQIAKWDEKKPKAAQYVDDLIYKSEMTVAQQVTDFRWLHLAQRHGLPVRVFPARITRAQTGYEKLENSVAFVDATLILEGEKALEGHTVGSAWLLAAANAKPGEKVDPDAREDAAELETEEVRDSREVVSRDAGMSGWIDMGKVSRVIDHLDYLLDEDDNETVSPPEGWPVEWDEEGFNSLFSIAVALKWVRALNGPKEESGEEEGSADDGLR